MFMNTNVETVTELHDCILIKHLLGEEKKEIVNMHPNPVNVFPLLLEQLTLCAFGVCPYKLF